MTRGRLKPARRAQGSVVVLLVAFFVLFLPMLALVSWRYNAAREYPPVHIRRERHGTRETSHTGSTDVVVRDSVQDAVAKTAVPSGASLDERPQLSGKPDIPQIREAGQETLADAQADMGQNQEDESDTGLSVDGLLLTPRVDAHCDLLSEATLGDSFKSEVFKCRVAASHALAERACDELAANPPDPPFTSAQLQIGQYAMRVPDLNVSSPSMSLYQSHITIAVEPRADFVSDVVSSSGVWEAAEVSTILEALQRVAPGAQSHTFADAVVPQEDRAVLLDIGANVGIFSFVAAVLGYTVYAFEAMPRNVAALHQTLCWNPGLRDTLTVFPYGLAEEEQACQIVSDEINVADGHVICTQEQLAAYDVQMTTRGTVHTVRMDSFLSGAHFDVVKIDVEGYEPHVLAGAGDSLKDVQYVMTELSTSDMPKKNNATFEEIGLHYLQDWEARGFAIHLCDDKHTCFDTPSTPANEAVGITAARGIVNALMVPAL